MDDRRANSQGEFQSNADSAPSSSASDPSSTVPAREPASLDPPSSSHAPPASTQEPHPNDDPPVVPPSEGNLDKHKEHHKHHLFHKHEGGKKTPSAAGNNPEGGEDQYFKDLSVEDALKKLETSMDGLSSQEVESRLQKYGHNALSEEKRSPLLQFLSFMWNPLSWAMEVAMLLSIILGDYLDFGLILALLLLNSSIAYYEETQAGNAIEALKAQLAQKSTAKRDGQWKNVESSSLVPGDIVRLKIGDVAPADVKLVEGDDLKVDQSALTGESLPVSKAVGSEIYSGSVIKMGEAEALVHSTGMHTFFGRTASLVAQTVRRGHFQTVLKTIGYFCISFISVFVLAEILVQFVARSNPCKLTGSEDGCPTLLNAIILIVGGIPIAMPTVLSVTMAIGAAQLAKRQAIVRRLTAVEELAGMDILCSDKTGTLTLNKLTVDVPVAVSGFTEDQVIFDAALASKHGDTVEDAIDIAIAGKVKPREEELRQFKILKFVPFDPVSKRATAKVQGPDGKVFFTTKGAPQIVLDLSKNKSEIEGVINENIESLALRGLRCIGIARSDDAEGQSWTMSGLVPLFDPPRDDTKDTIETALKLGVQVKMITGDQLAIAKETARRLGMGDKIFSAQIFHDRSAEEKAQALQSTGRRKELPKGAELTPLHKQIEAADGFSQVYPEHKFEIVHRLQEARHTVGMTGDGVNDAPALKRADIGIAVAGATDAARAAADIVLLSPGLHVIIDAMVGSRKIFERMRNYAMYSVSTTVRIVLTFSVLTFGWNFYFPTIAIVLITIFNDGTILTISKDRVQPSPEPDKWNLKEVFAIAVILGTWLAGTTIALFAVTYNSRFWTHFGLRELDPDEVRGAIYLYVSISGQATIFVTRTRRFFWQYRPATILLCAFITAQVVATFIGVYGLNGWPHNGRQDFRGCGWGYALAIWIYSLITFLPMDLLKIFITKYIFSKKVNYVDVPRHLRKSRKSKKEMSTIRSSSANPPSSASPPPSPKPPANDTVTGYHSDPTPNQPNTNNTGNAEAVPPV